MSPCTEEMYAWVRRCKAGPAVCDVELNIDLCDASGNVCIQMHGLRANVVDQAWFNVNAGGVHANLAESQEAFDAAFFEKLVADVEKGEISVNEAVGLS